MPEKNRIAVFDFCETLANFQTADAFVRFVIEHEGKTRWSIIYQILRKYKVVAALARLFPHRSINKAFVLLQLRGLSEESMIEYGIKYYQEIVKPNLIQETIDELRMWQSKGERILLASGGYDVYLRYFAEEYGIAAIDTVSTKLKFRRGVFTGFFDGPDCMRKQKVKRLSKILSRNACYIRAYSDSDSDLPLLLWADEPVNVVKFGSENSLSKFSFRHVIWNENNSIII